MNVTNTYESCLWLKSSKSSYSAMLTAVIGHDKWKCILQRLKMLKMNHINNQLEFHLTIKSALLDSELCATLLDRILEVCNEQIHSDENNTSFDIHSIICCFEFVSHWYLTKDRLLESLLFRQYQLELESKIFGNHPHVGWSLWFIGLIFEKNQRISFITWIFQSSYENFRRFTSKRT
jgi:hypothetical protein